MAWRASRGCAPAQVYTAGGGARNPAWTDIRQRLLGVPVVASPQAEAAYGAALLARQGLQAARA
jgi:sugar (pentulose or hexulose) kinase